MARTSIAIGAALAVASVLVAIPFSLRGAARSTDADDQVAPAQSGFIGRMEARPAGPVTSADLGGTWVGTGGPSGGIGYDIKMRPDNLDVMFVTDANAGVHRSTNGGATWTSVNQGIDARQGPSRDQIPAFCVTIDPNNPSVVWVGMQDLGGIYRSADGGATWEKRTTGIAETNFFTVRGIAVQPGNSNIVYAAGEIGSGSWLGRIQNGKEFDLVRGVVYKSTNGGQTWTAAWRGDNLARYVIIDPTNTSTLYLSTGIFDREAANSNAGANVAGGVGILKSTDAGASWIAINSGLRNLYVGSIFMHPRDPRTLVAGTGNISYTAGGGIYLTTDAGATWQYMTGAMITSVEFSASTPSLGYAAGSNEFFRSTDDGRTWRAVLNRNGQSWGPPNVLTGFPIDLQADPRDAQRVFVNNYAGGNFLTRDGGASWIVASDGYTGAPVTDVAVSRQDSSVVYVNTKSGPFKSTDGGQTWRAINPIDVWPVSEGGRVAVDPQDGNHVLMSHAHFGVTYESADGGVTFRVAAEFENELRALSTSSPRFQQGVQAFAIAPSDHAKVYAGFGYQACVLNLNQCDVPTILGVLTSENGGRSWTRHAGTGLDNTSVAAIVVHPGDRNTAWAGTLGKGIYITNDGGAHWAPASTGLGDLNVESLAVDARGAALYAGTSANGVYKSRDGVTWTAVSTGMNANEEIKGIAVDPTRADVLYAGSFASGVYATTNGGASWSAINTGLRNRSIRALAISSDGNILYAGTFGGGVFRLGGSTPAPGAPTSLTATSAGSSVTLNWAAPASGGTATSYVIEAGSATGLANLANFDTGSTATTFSASGVASGAYFVRVRATNAAGNSPVSNEAVLLVR